MRHKLILASASPRRKEILERLGLTFTILPARGEEKLTCTDPAEAVKELALQKAREVADQTEGAALVIGSDTVVACGGEIMGKPKDAEDAFRMLNRLQGASHTVYTGVAVIDTESQEPLVHFAEGTVVTMYPMTERQIWAYIRTGEPMDKAGAYAIQGKCSIYIREIRGEYDTVVGFPAARFYQELLKKNIDLLEDERHVSGLYF